MFCPNKGIAFENVTKRKLFAAIGIDTNHQIIINFGTRPFLFDFKNIPTTTPTSIFPFNPLQIVLNARHDQDEDFEDFEDVDSYDRDDEQDEDFIATESESISMTDDD